jgi:hypothetical protein
VETVTDKGRILCLIYGFKGYVVDARDDVAHYAGEKPGNVTKAVMQMSYDALAFDESQFIFRLKKV